MRLGVLISGSGRTLKNLIERIGDGRLQGVSIEVVVSSKGGVAGIDIARAAGLPVHVVERINFRTDVSFSRAVTRAIIKHKAELVVMAGLLHRWKFPPEFKGRVLNIHPALLPKFGGKGFYGHRVHKAVLAAGERESGCTVHFADLEYDHGPVILQRRVPVRRGDDPDSLAARVFEAELKAYPEAIRRVASGRILLIRGRIVPGSK
ncbi:MAG TPA: phosphoribosylglycinamide formyltransferase [Planctomycetota bacterium]|nr:phosphoribosylglycinamide formyltransferase [Planctomycetota bacterium]